MGGSLLFWRRPRVQVIELHGMLASRAALNAAAFAPLVARAFAAAGEGGQVILDIDSPGGSPVQSDLIAGMIRRHAEKRKARVVAVIQEVGASGGYWLACAADEILASPMSVVGSIGVIGGGFGFAELIERLGVERRVYTAGANKSRLDPFRPERPEDVAFVRQILDELHVRFKDWVRLRRGDRLKADEAALFDGGWCLGARAREVGLIDGFGDLDGLVRRLGGERAVARVHRPRRRGLFRRLPRILAEAAFEVVEERRGRVSLLAAPAEPGWGPPR